MRTVTAAEALGLRFDQQAPAARAALVLLLAALWLLGRRYSGIVQDASLYLVQGLHRLDPGVFDRDLFFAHGSQDAFTVFPELYARLIDAFGIGAAAMLVSVAGQAAFVAASIALVCRIASGPARWWSLALLAMISGYYGGVGVHRLAEPFATARSLAEPLVLAAVACTLVARHRWAFGALIAALLLHPLVAAPGMAVVFLWHLPGRRRLIWSIAFLAALSAALLLSWNAISPTLDPLWRAVVLDRSPQLFLSQWLLPDWSRLLWGFCVAWLAAGAVEEPARRLIDAAAATCLAGLAASAIAVDLLDSAAAAALQLWRAHWLLHYLAIVLVPVAVASLWRSGYAARTAAACLAASCCFGRAEQPAAAALAALAVALGMLERRRPGWIGESAYRVALLGLLGAASVGLLFEIQERLPPIYDMTRLTGWTDYVHAAASVGGLLPFASAVWLFAYSRYAGTALVLAAAGFALSIAAWDARMPWPRFVEQASAGANPFRDALPRNAVVYWPGPYGKAWLALGKPAWLTVDQGAGVVFNRGTAIEYAERERDSAGLRSAEDNCALLEPSSCRIRLQPARELCVRDGGPDDLVLNARIEGFNAVEWPLPRNIGPGRQALFLYACRDLAGQR